MLQSFEYKTIDLLAKIFQKTSRFISKNKKKSSALAFILLLSIFSQIITIHPLNLPSFNASLKATASIFNKDVKDLVLILVDQDLLDSDNRYETSYAKEYSSLKNETIRSRVERYAEDIQLNIGQKYENPEISIVSISKNQSPVQIAALLKQAYNQNLDTIPNSKLEGVVIIGSVPLPVVDKNGNRFVSMYPYTDFVDPQYVYDQDLDFFSYNPVQDPEPEVWHGLINQNEPQQLAEFFDKNHLYYQGEVEFADFEQKIFYSEPKHDFKAFNQDLYLQYKTYQTLLEEFSYNRFSRKLIELLENSGASLQLAQLQGSDDIKQPDIFTKPIIEKYITEITDIFSVALRDQQQAVSQTGRYSTGDYVSGLQGVAKVDELSSLYLKEVNNLIEQELVAILKDVQVDIPLLKGSILTPTIQFKDQNGDLITQEQDQFYFVNHARSEDILQVYLRFVPGLTDSLLGLPTDEILNKLFIGDLAPLGEDDLINSGTLKVHGTDLASLNSPTQCRLYRGGGTLNPLDKTVRTHRGLILDREADPTQSDSARPVCYNRYNPNDKEDNWKKITESSSLFDQGVNACTTFSGTDLQDLYRTDEVQLDFQSDLTHESCSGMRLAEDYLDAIKLQYSNTSDVASLQNKINQLNSKPNYTNLQIAPGLTLSQVVGAIPTYQSVSFSQNSSLDWHAFSSQILNNPVQNKFDIQNPTPNIENISLKIDQIPTGKNISSLIVHADPSPGMISKAYEVGNPDLPINATRYATFVDKEGRKQQLVFPNAFKSNSIPQLRQELKQVEDLLSSLSPSGDSYTGQLQNLIGQEEDVFDGQVLKMANQSKLKFLIDWQNYDLNQKYLQIHEQILDPNNTIQLDNIPQSFEIAHIASSTTDTGLDFNLLDFQTLSPQNPITKEFKQNFQDQQKQEKIKAQTTIQQDSVNLFEYFTDYLPEWYDEQQQKVSSIFKPSSSELTNPDDVFKSYEELEQVEQEQKSQSMKVSLSSSIVSVNSSQGVSLSIDILQDNQVVESPKPQIYLSDPGLAKVIDNNSSQQNNSSHSFQIIPFKKSGSLDITIQPTNRNIQPQILTLDIQPLEATNINFKSSSTKLSQNQATKIEMTLTDEFNNPTFSSIQNLQISFDEPAKLQDPPSQVDFINGKAEISLEPAQNAFGNVYLKVEGPNLSPSYKKLILNTELSLQSLKDIEFNSLVLNLFLDKSNQQTKSTIQDLLATSKVQAVSSLTTSLSAKQPVLYIHPTGSVEELPSSKVSSEITFTTSGIGISLNDNQNNKIADIDFKTESLPISLVSNSLNQFVVEPLQQDKFSQDESTIKYENQILFTINSSQNITSINPNLTLEIQQGQKPSFNLLLSGEIIAVLNIISNNPDLVSIRPNSRNPQIGFQASNTMNNSNFPLGFVFYNTKLDISEDQLPSSSDIRPEDFISQKQVGLKQGSKLLHLLSSQSLVGEANRPHLSEAGIVYGDPAISLPYRSPQKLSNMNFNDTIGEYIGRNSSSVVVDIVSIPNQKMTFIAYQNGQVSMYDHQTKSFTKNYLKIPNGIKQILRAELQEDKDFLVFLTDRPCSSNDTCIYAFNTTDQASKVGQLQKINPNQSQTPGINFSRNELSTLNKISLNSDSKAIQILFQDMNQDNLDDLLLINQNQILNLHWNQNGQINPNGSIIGHTKIALQDSNIIVDDVLVSGLIPSQSQFETTPLYFPSNPQQSTVSNQTINRTTQSQIIKDTSTKLFANLNSIGALKGSTIQIQDLNGGTLSNNDRLRYNLTFNNNSSNQYSNLDISFPINSNLTIDPSSLSSNLSIIATKNSSERPFVIRGVNLAPNSIQKVSIDFIYNIPVSQKPSIISITPESKENTFPVQDGYPDIQIITPGNPDQTYFYSDYDKSSNVLKFKRLTLSSNPSSPNNAQNFLDQFTDSNGNPINLSTSSDDEKEDFAKSLSAQTLDRDADNDGIIDIYDGSPSNSVQQAGSTIENTIKDLTCDGGGCLAVPFNHAFLVPDKKTPGLDLPVFGWGCPPGPFIPPTWPPVAHQSCAGGRIYVSPTLTGEFAGSVCLGPYLAGQCFTFNMFDLGEVCQKINQKVQESLKNANEFIQNEGGGVITVGNDPSQNQPSNINIPGFPKPITDWIANQWEEIQNKLLDPPDISIVYPDPDSLIGFVTPVNNQEDRRFLFTDPYPECKSEEIYNNNPEKCGNLSSYQDVLISQQNAKSKASFKGVKDVKAVLEEIALMPLFNINYEKVYITYPWINEDELGKYSLQIDKVWDQFKFEAFVKGQSWGCFKDLNYTSVTDVQKALDEGTFLQSVASVSNQAPEVQAACVRLAAGFEGIDLNIKENFQRIQAYRDIPKNIFKVENFLANYIDQLLQYAEVILQNTLGWLTENTNNLLQWEQTVLEIEGLVDDLKVLLDFSVDFMESCDDCRSNRTNTEGVEGLLSIFLNLSPDLPIIEVPSFPDITLDVSNIQAGIDVTLPDIEFKPDPITLPSLDLSLNLPEVPSSSISISGSNFSGQGINLEAYLEGFEIPLLPEPPTIDTTTLFADLPDLPELEIPELPSIPKPPSIKQFTSEFTDTINPTVETLSTITRIYCLITKGIVPIPELELKSQIETITNRPLTPVLPVDIGFQLPKPQLEGQYIDEIIFKLTTQLNLEFPEIQEQTEKLANKLNSFSSNIADQIEQGLENSTQFLRQEINLPSESINDAIEDQDLNFTLDGDITSFKQLEQKINHLSQLSQDINTSFQGNIYLKSTSKKLKDISLPENLNIASIESYNSHPLVQKQNQSKQKNQLIASVNKVSQQPIIKNENFKLKSFLAQSTPSPSSLKASTDYNANTGVYVIDNSDNIQPLIAYKSPSQVNSKVDMLDTDNDGDQDVIYTLEGQIFFKQNQSVRQASSASRVSVKTYEFQDFVQDLPPLSTVSYQQINPIFTHNKLSFQNPAQNSDETLVLDTFVYKDLNTLEPYIRFVISNQENLSLDKANFQELVQVSSTNTVSLQLSNGTYMGQLSVLGNNRLSVLQSEINISPNSCGDLKGPQISVKGSLTQKVPLFGNFDLDLSQTTDLESELLSIFIDNDLSKDTNGDGVKTNDPDLQGSQNLAATKFQLGPFNSLTTKVYQIHAEDINGNTSQTNLTLEVVAPDINLSQSNQNTFISQLDPISGNVPVTFVRQRDGLISKLGTSNTNSKGQAKLTTSNDTNSLVIKDSNSKPIYRVNQNTGAIISLDPEAMIKVKPWIQDKQNTSVELSYKDLVLTKIQKVSDPAFAPIITSQNLQDINFTDSEGVTIQDTDPENSWRTSLVENNLIIYNQSPDDPSVTISSSGQINIIKQDIQLDLSEIQNINQPQWYEFYANSVLQFNMYVGISKSIEIQDPTIVQETTPVQTVSFDPSTIQNKPKFQDIDETNPNKAAIDRLQSLNIIQGIERDGQFFFEPNRNLLRSEYAKVILEALCLAPSPQSKVAPQVFDDIPFTQNNLPWYYSYTKETQLLGLFSGYLGETNPQNNLAPFKPLQSITTAEAAKVILEALELKGIIQFSLPSDYPPPWYAPYITISRDITPFVTPKATRNGSLKSNFLLTEQESLQPNKLLTREEFAVIASRVLDIYNCFEEESSVTPPLDPSTPSSPTSPQPVTSVELSFPQPNKPGIYIDDIACNVCPCPYTLDYEDDIIDKDIIFSLILGPNQEVYSRSNVLTIQR